MTNQNQNRTFMFVGSKQIGLRALQSLAAAIPRQISSVITFDDSKDTRSCVNEFKDYCLRSDLEFQILNRPGDLVHAVESYQPYSVLVVGWYWLLPPRLLSMVQGGFLGIHASLLPKYRGNAPLVWAVLRGETKTGVTLFYFDEGMDSGDIVGQFEIPIEACDTISDVLVKAENASAQLVERFALGLLEGIAPRLEQDHSRASYVSLRRPEDGWIDWKQPASDIYNFIRAQTHPYPGAFTWLPDGRVLRIWSGSIFPFPYYGIAGLVGNKYKDGVIVSCGEGAVIIRECQIEDSTPVSARSLLKRSEQLGKI